MAKDKEKRVLFESFRSLELLLKYFKVTNKPYGINYNEVDKFVTRFVETYYEEI